MSLAACRSPHIGRVLRQGAIPGLTNRTSPVTPGRSSAVALSRCRSDVVDGKSRHCTVRPVEHSRLVGQLTRVVHECEGYAGWTCCRKERNPAAYPIAEQHVYAVCQPHMARRLSGD